MPAENTAWILSISKEIMSVRNKKILRQSETALLVIDIQERLLPAMNNPEELKAGIIKLVRGFNILNLPVYYTEQYPKGLGNTVKELQEELKSNAVEKLSFSCADAGNLFKELIDKGITQVVVCGIESHVCVQQTVLDLLAGGFQVDVAADGVSSRKVFDFETALNRMRANGAEITTTESILFELLQVCGTDEFKAISKLVK